jgi:hypothetical protein
MMDWFHVLPPWGPHREGFELAEDGAPVIAGHEGHHPVHNYYLVRHL